MLAKLAFYLSEKKTPYLMYTVLKNLLDPWRVKIKKKSRILETTTLLTDADSSTAAKKLLSNFFFLYPAAAARGLLGKK